MKKSTGAWEKLTTLDLVMLEHALERESVSFSHLAVAFYGSSPKYTQDQVAKDKFAELFGPLLDAFETAHGKIVACHFCQQIAGAAAYTDTGELHMGYPVREGRETEALLFECERMGIEVKRLLEGEDRTAALRRLYKLATWLLDILDHLAGTGNQRGDESAKIAGLLRAELQDIKEFYLRAAERSASVTYFKGMLWGALPMAGVAWLGSVWPAFPVMLVVALVGGSLGAFVSVLSRMSKGALQLQTDAGERLLRLLGSFRPLIGGIMGVAIGAMVVSGILPVKTPGAEAEPFFFFTLGFLAGFTERWAQDMVTGAQGRLGGAGSGDSHSENVVPVAPTELRDRNDNPLGRRESREKAIRGWWHSNRLRSSLARWRPREGG